MNLGERIMKIKRSEFLSALEILNMVLPTKAQADMPSELVFIEEWAISYNGVILIAHPFKHKLQMALPGKELLKIVSGIDEDEIIVTKKDNQLKIKGSSTRGGLVNDSTSLEMIEKMWSEMYDSVQSNTKWRELPDDFFTGLDLCQFSISHDTFETVFSSICVENNHIVSTDNYRLSSFELDDSLEDSFLLPYESIKILTKLKPSSYIKNDPWTVFKTDNGVLIYIRKIEAEYPDVFPEFIDKERNIVVELPEELNDSLDSISAFAEGESDLDISIEMTIEDGKLTCSGSKSIGWMEKEFSLDYKGDKLSFKINPHFLSQVLNKSGKMIYSQNQNRVQFTCDKFEHVIILFSS